MSDREELIKRLVEALEPFARLTPMSVELSEDGSLICAFRMKDPAGVTFSAPLSWCDRASRPRSAGGR